MKVVDKMRKSMEQGANFYSFEFFPPRTDEVSPYLILSDDINRHSICRVILICTINLQATSASSARTEMI